MRSVSADFNTRWLTTPTIAKQAFHQELSDIIAMLQSPSPADEFEFSYPDFASTIKELLRFYDDKPTDNQSTPTLPKIEPVVSVPSPLLTPLNTQDLEVIQDKLYSHLSIRIDDFLSDHMASLSEELKLWLQNAIKEELAHLSPQP